METERENEEWVLAESLRWKRRKKEGRDGKDWGEEERGRGGTIRVFELVVKCGGGSKEGGERWKRERQKVEDEDEMERGYYQSL